MNQRWSLEDIFTDDVIRKLSGRPAKSKELAYRLEVIQATGVAGISSPHYKSSIYRPLRAAWDAYISAAASIGLIKDPLESDVARRLTSPDDSNFRGAMSECMAAWYFAGRLRWPIKPRPSGRGNSELELCISTTDGNISVEVKAPFREVEGDVWYGLDSEALGAALESANKQFETGTQNLLFIAPRLRISVSTIRYQVIEALIGSEVIVEPIGLIFDANGDPFVSPPHTAFRAKGKFTRSVKADRKPAFTRVSAAIIVEEFMDSNNNGPFINHSAFIVHNPNAEMPLDSAIFGDLIQFKEVQKGAWGWSDGHPLSF